MSKRNNILILSAGRLNTISTATTPQVHPRHRPHIRLETVAQLPTLSSA